MGSIEEEFEWVRRTFFPRWDKKREWNLVLLDEGYGAAGRCDWHDRTIKIFDNEKPTGDPLTVLLIHEIAHAVARSGHFKMWTNRMELAARLAERLGKSELARLLRADAHGYLDAPHSYTAAEIYNRIGEALIDCPDVSFEGLLEGISREFGAMPPRDILRRYKLVRRVYDTHRDRRQRALLLREQAMQRVGIVTD